MTVLVYWEGDWFIGRPVEPPQEDRRFVLWATTHRKYESIGFHRDPDSPNPRYRRYFVRDPGFKYFPIVQFQGNPVSVECFAFDSHPQQVRVRRLSPDVGSSPPDPENWTMVSPGRPIDGYYRYVSINDLEKEEGTIPDWSLRAD